MEYDAMKNTMDGHAVLYAQATERGFCLIDWNGNVLVNKYSQLPLVFHNRRQIIEFVADKFNGDASIDWKA
jgi:hypothetical protein